MKKVLILALLVAGVVTSAVNACCHRMRCCDSMYGSRTVSSTPYELVYPE